MSSWYLYIIENRLKHLYTGITKDVKRRYAEHQSSGPKCAKALRGKGPIQLVFCAKLESHSDALKAEHWVKRLGRSDKVKVIKDKQQLPFPHEICCLDVLLASGDQATHDQGNTHA